MPRVKRGVTARARHKKVLALAKGFRGRRGNVYRIAKEAVMKAGQYAYRDRRAKKRVFRQLWIARINAAAREFGITYSLPMVCAKRPSKLTARCWLTSRFMTKPLLVTSWIRSRPNWQLDQVSTLLT
jgi:ribosomal protein L20